MSNKPWRKIANKAIDLIAEFKSDDNYVRVENTEKGFVFRRRKLGFHASRYSITDREQAHVLEDKPVSRGDIRKMVKHDVKNGNYVMMHVNGQSVVLVD